MLRDQVACARGVCVQGPLQPGHRRVGIWLHFRRAFALHAAAF
jgi:hypothetical protein